MSAHSLTLKKTREGMELRVAYTFKGKRPTPRQAQKMAEGLLEEAIGSCRHGAAVDGGFKESAHERSGVAHLVLEYAS